MHAAAPGTTASAPGGTHKLQVSVVQHTGSNSPSWPSRPRCRVSLVPHTITCRDSAPLPCNHTITLHPHPGPSCEKNPTCPRSLAAAARSRNQTLAGVLALHHTCLHHTCPRRIVTRRKAKPAMLGASNAGCRQCWRCAAGASPGASLGRSWCQPPSQLVPTSVAARASLGRAGHRSWCQPLSLRAAWPMPSEERVHSFGPL